MSQQTHSWTVTLKEDEEDLFLPFPPNLLEQLGWKEGTTIYWIDNKNGTFTLTDKEEDVISS